MNRIVYTATMAKHASRAAEVILAERASNQGRVDLREILELITPASSVETFIKVFSNWHSMFVASANTSAGKLMSTAITNEPPLVVAGQLNEFARAINVIVDTAKILVDAANIVNQYGHFKRGPGNYSCGFCIAGAIEVAIKNGLTTRKIGHGYAEVLWASAIGVLADYLHTHCLTEWNDSPNTQTSDVISTLKWAASDIVTVRL